MPGCVRTAKPRPKLWLMSGVGASAIGSNGQASLTFPTSGLEAGNYAITATYSGDAGDAVSTSKAQTVTVQ